MTTASRRVVLVGTGTGVGKTHVGCVLLRRWSAAVVLAVGLKPIETGLGSPEGALSDQARLLRAAGAFHVKHQGGAFHVKHQPYGFARPVSPHLASREAGIRIDLGVVRRWVEDEAAPITLVETAGGLFSPLDQTATNLDLAAALRPAQVILVGSDRLGVLHEVTATLGFARSRGFTVDGVVLSAPPIPDSSTGHNEHELRRLNIADVQAVFPRASETDPSSLEAASRLITWINAN